MEYTCVSMHTINDYNGKSYVGIEKTSGDYKIILPYGLLLSNNALPDSNDFIYLKHFIKSIIKSHYLKRKMQNDYLTYDYGSNIESGLWLANDYLENGLLKEYKNVWQKRDTGEINFKKTFAKCNGLIIGGEIMYDKYIVKSKANFRDDIVLLAQKMVLNQFFGNIGTLLFGFKLDFGGINLNLDNILLSQLLVLKSRTYNNRKSQIITHLINYIKYSLKTNNDYGKWEYSIVASTLWEDIIDACFSNQEGKNRQLYGRRYSVLNINAPTKNLHKSEHDTIYEDVEKVIIIDAKMYGNEEDLYRADLLSKQFGYFGEARRKNPHKKIFNILVMPSSDDNSEFIPIIIPNPEELQHVVKDLDNVILIYKIPYLEAMESYLEDKNIIESLILELNDFISLKEYGECIEAYFQS